VIREIPSNILGKVVKSFTHPLHPPSPIDASNLFSLKSRIKLGDVVLVSGTARVSKVVKVLTRSKWSHVVIYVGSRKDLLSEKEIEEWTIKYGSDCMEHLVIDADPIKGVHLKPVDDFAGYVLRHCRAQALDSEDCKKVVDVAISQLGREYDIKHILKLLLFFAIPWELLPELVRKKIRDFTLSEDDRICSRVIAEAFHSVGYPIRPLKIVSYKAPQKKKFSSIINGIKNNRKTASKLLMGGKLSPALKRLSSKPKTEIQLGAPRHITPADYDLSKFFIIIKDEEDLNISYKNAKLFCPLPE